MASTLKPWLQGPPKRYRLVDCSLIDPKDGQSQSRHPDQQSDG